MEKQINNHLKIFMQKPPEKVLFSLFNYREFLLMLVLYSSDKCFVK